MIGGQGTWSAVIGPAGSSNPGYVTTFAQTFAGVKTFTDGIAIGSTATPTLTLNATTTTICTEVASSATDTGSNPIKAFNARIGASTDVATRPLFAFQNNGATILSILPLNSGDNSCLSWGTQGVGAPAFTSRSVGTRLVLYNALSGAAADHAIGVESNTLWFSVPTTSQSYKWYGGTAAIMTLAGSGQLTLTAQANLKSYTVATLPAATTAGGFIYVSNEAGGATPAFSDGTNWRRCTDLTIVS